MKPKECLVPECEGVVLARGWCRKHYERAKGNDWNPIISCQGCGLELQKGARRYCSEDCKPRCTIEGCEQPKKKRGWCSKHYSMWHYTGDPLTPPKFKFAEEWICIVCQSPVEVGSGMRRYCSVACQTRYSIYKGNPPTSIECSSCGVQVSLAEKGQSGRRRMASTRRCKKCAHTDNRPWRKLIPAIIERDGLTCGICDEQVDPDLSYPDLRYLTVDHIIPRSCGGTNDLTNLRVAHLLCNSLRGSGLATSISST